MHFGNWQRFIVPMAHVILMKTLRLLMVLLLLAVATVPAQAFTANNLDIAVRENGDAAITFTYQLNWFEYFVVFLRIADPATQLQNALESNLGRPVVVHSVSPGMLSMDVEGFASVQPGAQGITYVTPPLDFTAAARYLKQQWFSGMVSADFSPEVSTVRFPDGFAQPFYNQDYIPSVTHTVSR